MGRLALVSYGEHGTIPYDWRNLARFYPQGECDRQNSPGSGSKLYYINSWTLYHPAEKIRECARIVSKITECARIVSKIYKCARIVLSVLTLQNLCTPVALCAHLVRFVQTAYILCTPNKLGT